MSAEVSPAPLAGGSGVGDGVVVTQRRMRLVWLVLWSGFAGFLLLCAGLAFATFAFATRSSEVRGATLERKHGQQLEVQRAGSREWVLFPSSALTITLNEGDSVRTGEDTDALITLMPHLDNSTVQLYYASEIRLDTLRTSRFLDQEKTIGLTQRQGIVQYSMADRSPYASVVTTIYTEQARITLADNTTARVSLVHGPASAPPYSQVVAQGGTTLVWVGDQAAHPAPGQQVRAYAGGTLLSPERASDELFRNVEFVTPPEAPDEVLAGWTASPGPRDPQDGAHVITHTEAVDLEPRSVELTRATNAQGGLKVVLHQELNNQQVNFYGTLTLQLRVKVVDQPPTSSAGGPYPLLLQMHYYDQAGHEKTWEWGFYYDPQAATPPPNDPASPLVKKGAWQERTFDLKRLVPDMAQLRAVEVVGNGPQFSVWVSGLSLIGK